MPVRAPRYSKEEFARRGREIYESLLPEIEPQHHGRFACIDIESGSYEIGDDELTTCERLWARCPDAQPWMVRVGFDYLHRL
jgi:hypothetical protein